MPMLLRGLVGGTTGPSGLPTLFIDGVETPVDKPVVLTVGTHTITATAPCDFSVYGTAGGGGGGGGLQYLNDGQAGGGGGGAGAAVYGMDVHFIVGPVYTVTIGSGGAGAPGSPPQAGLNGGGTTIVDASLGTVLSLGGGQGGGYGARLGGVAGRGLGGAGGSAFVGTLVVAGGAGGDGAGTEWRPDQGTAGAVGGVFSAGLGGPGGGGGGGKADPSQAGLPGGTALRSVVPGGAGGTAGDPLESHYTVPTPGQGGLPYWGDGGTTNPWATAGGGGGGGGGMILPSGLGFLGGGGGGGAGPAGASAGQTPWTVGGRGMNGGLVLVYKPAVPAPPTPPDSTSPALIIDGVRVELDQPIYFGVGAKSFTATKPCTFTVVGTAGGGGGGGGMQYLNDGQAGGGGGGGGAAVDGMVLACDVGPTYTVTVGAAGLGATTKGASGTSGGPTGIFNSWVGAVLSLGGGAGGGYGAFLGGVVARGLGGAGGVATAGTAVATGGAGGDASGTEVRPGAGTPGTSGGSLPTGGGAPSGGGGGGKADLSTAGLAGGSTIAGWVPGGAGGRAGDPTESNYIFPAFGQGGPPYWGAPGAANPNAACGGGGGGGGGMPIPGFGFHGGGGGGGGGPAGPAAGQLPWTNGGNGMDGGVLLTYIAPPVTPKVPPSIVTQPASQGIMAGQTAALAVGVSGDAPFSYQWYAGASPVVGANAASYLTPALSSTTTYTVVVTNAAGSVTSAVATITVTQPVPPTVVTQPVSQPVSAGQSVTLSVVASGDPPLSYQWYLGGTSGAGSPVAGATAASYTTPPVTSVTTYWVRVSNLHGSVDSAPATITVTRAPVIVAQPANHAVTQGETATLSVSATGDAPLTYQWYLGTSGAGTAIGGATASVYTTPALSVTTTYWVRVSNPFGTADSVTVTVTAAPAPVPPSIVTQPVSQVLTPGQTATLSASAAGNTPLTYQWFSGPHDGTAVVIAGATASVYTTPALATTTTYWVRVANPYGSVDSVVATITVTQPALPQLIFEGASYPVEPPFFLDVGTRSFSVTRPCAFTVTGTAGGGGGGGGLRFQGDGQGAGGGGGGGAAVSGLVLTCAPGRTYTVTVGAGGIGAIGGTPSLGAKGGPGGPTSVVDSAVGTVLSLGGGDGGSYGARQGGVAGYGLGGAGGTVSAGTSTAPGGAGGDAGGTEFRPAQGTPGGVGSGLPDGTVAPAGGGGGGKADASMAGSSGGVASAAVGAAAGGAAGNPEESHYTTPTPGHGGQGTWGDGGTVAPFGSAGGGGGGGGGMPLAGHGYCGGGGGGGGGPAGSSGSPWTRGGNGMPGGILLTFVPGSG